MTRVFHDATTGEWIEVDGGDESYCRMEAANRLGCAESDLREGYGFEDDG
ncbi:hypothetical protein [Halostella litorea]|nr:hypothetical protein [Halostella litorea]